MRQRQEEVSDVRRKIITDEKLGISLHELFLEYSWVKNINSNFCKVFFFSRKIKLNPNRNSLLIFNNWWLDSRRERVLAMDFFLFILDIKFFKIRLSRNTKHNLIFTMNSLKNETFFSKRASEHASFFFYLKDKTTRSRISSECFPENRMCLNDSTTCAQLGVWCLLMFMFWRYQNESFISYDHRNALSRRWNWTLDRLRHLKQ